MDAQKDDDFRAIINESSLSVPDGVGVIFAEKFLNKVESIKKTYFFLLELSFTVLG